MGEELSRRRVPEKLRKRRLLIHDVWSKYPSIPGVTDDIDEYLIDIAETSLEALKKILVCVVRRDGELEDALIGIKKLRCDSKALALDMLEIMPDILLGTQVNRVTVFIYPENDTETLLVEFHISDEFVTKGVIVDSISRLIFTLVNKAKV